MYEREMKKELLKAASQYPVVTVTGPRQSGKTTLVRSTFSNKPYRNLEDPNTQALALRDPKGFLMAFPEGAVLDEIQRAPSLLSMIQVIVDETNTKGMFILTGSHQLQLHESIAQSLAGRTALLKLLPLSITELETAGFVHPVDQFLYEGCFPRIYQDHLNPTQAYGNYVQTYLERDLRQMIEVRNLQLFQRFLVLCAGRIGQLLNKEGLANEVGVSARTIGEWLSILEASHIAFLLPPYFNNIGKRVTKRPKLYFCDVGLAAYLLGIENPQQLSRDPSRGNLFENLVILELMKKRLNQGLDPRLFFYRDAQQHEVDLLYQRGHELVAIEIKSAATFDASFLRGLSFIKRILGERCVGQYLIYAGKEEQQVDSAQLLSFRNTASIIG